MCWKPAWFEDGDIDIEAALGSELPGDRINWLRSAKWERAESMVVLIDANVGNAPDYICSSNRSRAKAVRSDIVAALR